MTDSAEQRLRRIAESSSYLLAEEDIQLLKQDELRPVRMQLELLKPEMILAANKIRSTIVVFGGTRIVERATAEAELAELERSLATAADDAKLLRAKERLKRQLAKCKYYDEAREFGRLVSTECQTDDKCDHVIVTGGGPGIMEAANRGAFDVGAKSVGLNITLPHEQEPNSYITPELCFLFRYFAMRKLHFLMRAKALVIFPGGFGTLDEMFDALTLRQTNRMQKIPIILYSRDYWSRVIDFQFLADEGVIDDEDLQLIQYAETPSEAWNIVREFDATSEARLPLEEPTQDKPTG